MTSPGDAVAPGPAEEYHHHHEIHHEARAVTPLDVRIHALNLSVSLHTQSLRHLFSKAEDGEAAAMATGEVLGTADRFADWMAQGGAHGQH